MRDFLDFSVIKDLGKVAIHCKSEHDAVTLLKEMWAQHPERMDHWSHTNTKWDTYKEDTCYAPHIYDRGAHCMQYCNTAYWLSEGYRIIQFEEIALCKQDFGEFEISNIDILGL